VGRVGWLLGSGLGSGLAPVAPATVASFAAVVLYYFLPISGDSIALYLMIGVGFVLGIWATGTLCTVDQPDPSVAVLDEFVGMWATCLLLPKTIPWMAAAFLTFRILDVVKPWPINRLERLPGGLGIMSDDLAAGLVGALILYGSMTIFFS
jgi:phosphatidylglycerophosphatase A